MTAGSPARTRKWRLQHFSGLDAEHGLAERFGNDLALLHLLLWEGQLWLRERQLLIV